MPNYEIITDGGHRRRWSSAEKHRIIEETLEDGVNISVIARRRLDHVLGQLYRLPKRKPVEHFQDQASLDRSVRECPGPSALSGNLRMLGHLETKPN